MADKEKDRIPDEAEETAEKAEEMKEESDKTASDGEPSEEASEEEKEPEEETAEERAEEAEEKEEREEAKNLFKKKGKSEKKKDPMKEKVEELEDKVKRQLAEFENFRNRTEKEKTQMFELGAKSVIEKILPVVDNFERGLASVSEEDKGKPFVEGMELVYKQLMTELDKMEVKPIPAVGEEFNPEFHNAVMQVDSEEYESGIVAQELQKGYTYRDSVVRHSMVAVVN